MRPTSASNMAGWVFADLLLAIALIFMGLNAAVVPQTEPKPTPAPPPGLVSLVLTPATITGGSPVTAAVTLASRPDGSVPIKVAMSSSNTSTATVAALLDSTFDQTASTVISTKGVALATTVTITATLGSVVQRATLTVVPPIAGPDVISLTSICRVIHVDGGWPFTSLSQATISDKLRQELQDLAGPTGPRAKLVLTFGVAREGQAAERLSAFVNDLLKGADLRGRLGELLKDGDALQARDYIHIARPKDNEGDVRIELFVQSKPGAPTPSSRPDCTR